MKKRRMKRIRTTKDDKKEEKKVIIGIEEHFEACKKATADLNESIDDHRKIARDIRELISRVNIFLKKYDSHFIECKRSLISQETYLKENNKLHHMVDESLGNMLMAINQNEYLKAWYPEQHGYPAMKVVGQHPAKNAKKV